MIVITCNKSRPATAKVSFSKFKELGIAPGKWVQIDTPTLKVFFFFLKTTNYHVIKYSKLELVLLLFFMASRYSTRSCRNKYSY